MPSPLHDLDELTLLCRDEKARLYIVEAVSSYRAGAFRSAIVATWIAVCFDVIEKFRELALAGDKEAEKQIQDLEAGRKDLTRALKFERELLQLARDKFELISPLEFIDLERLQADRNRCAHPSLTSDEQAYTPSAELARLHLHSAVTHLLQHAPVQGKFALNRLVKEIESDYFPSDAKDAATFLGSGPLRRPRESLVRNLVLVLVKGLLKDPPEYKRRMRLSAALQAIHSLHPEQYGRCCGEKLTSMFRSVEDTSLSRCTDFLKYVPDSWQYLDVDVQQRLQNYVLNLPAADLDDIDFLLDYVPLQVQARERVRRANRQELSDAIFFDLPAEVADRFIEIYLESRSFDQANQWAKEISTYVSDLNAEHVRQLLTSVGLNDQLIGSFQLAPLISALRGSAKLPAEEFERLLLENGLEEHTLAAKKKAAESLAAEFAADENERF